MCAAHGAEMRKISLQIGQACRPYFEPFPVANWLSDLRGPSSLGGVLVSVCHLTIFSLLSIRANFAARHGGCPMVQIIPMATGEPQPSETDHVLIEPLPAGKFAAHGSAIHPNRVAFFNPSPFGTLDDAIAVSKIWAEENKVPVIYVKAGA